MTLDHERSSVRFGVSPTLDIEVCENLVDSINILLVELDIGGFDVLASTVGVGRSGDGNNLWVSYFH